MNSAVSLTSNQSFAIRLWSPENSNDATNQTGQLTLRQAYEHYYRPGLVQADAAANTFKEYERALAHWERLMPGNPTLSQLDDSVMLQFRSAADMATRTCNKWFRHLRAVLNKMGPRLASDKRSRSNLRYFAEVPLLEDLEMKRQELAKVRPLQVRAVTINALYKHSEVAKWPPRARTGVDPATWWRAVLVL